MQRILNDPQMVVEDMLEGFAKAHKNTVDTCPNPRVIKYKKAPMKGKVGIVTGGGSGHKPAVIGYIWKNLLDAVAVVEIFSSPTAKAFTEAFVAADSGEGVACLYGNYAGDNMNVKMAMESAKELGIHVKTVIANDDVASAPLEEKSKRRGVAGEIMMWKAGGAKAALGGNLDEVIAAAQKAIDNCRSIGIGLSSCTIPAVGKPNFHIEPGKMEVGIGHHGEPGVEVRDIANAREMAKIMMDAVVPDLPVLSGDEVVVLISGLGATPVSELYVLFNEVEKILADKGINIYRAYVGSYFTSLDMIGATLTLMKLDDELKQLVDLEVDSMGLKQFAIER
ncbi:MAG: dihydroxyacetone kinase subunit DhaK [Treponema sp.]|nr:dihydroxyacetone kinase subunit DhaK [Treponema sp.]